MPAQAANFKTSRARESANPPRLGRGETRGSTGARDQFPTMMLPWPSRSGVRLLSGFMQVQVLPEAPPSQVMSKQHARLLTGSSWCKSRLGSHFPPAPLVYLLAQRLFTPQKPGRHRHGVPMFFMLPRCKSGAQRPTKAEVRGASPRGSTNVDHDVTVSIPPCEGGSAGASPVGQPTFRVAHVMKRRIIGLQNRFTRCKSGVRVHFQSAL